MKRKLVLREMCRMIDKMIDVYNKHFDDVEENRINDPARAMSKMITIARDTRDRFMTRVEIEKELEE